MCHMVVTGFESNKAEKEGGGEKGLQFERRSSRKASLRSSCLRKSEE